jgi:hypothetical protein
LLTRGLEWDLVTSRSESRTATVLLFIEVPRSAWTTCGVPWIPNVSLIISAGNTAHSELWTAVPTM